MSRSGPILIYPMRSWPSRFIVDEDLFDGRTYNADSECDGTSNRRCDPRVRSRPLPPLFADSLITNQSGLNEVSCRRFEQQGFTLTGDLRRGIGETYSIDSAHTQTAAELETKVITATSLVTGGAGFYRQGNFVRFWHEPPSDDATS